MPDFPESDWKKLRDMRDKALNRLCARILTNIEIRCRLERASGSPHKAYGQIYALVRDSDKIVAELFDDWRRSTVLWVLCGWVREGLLTRDEFECLSEETKNSVRSRVKVRFYDTNQSSINN